MVLLVEHIIVNYEMVMGVGGGEGVEVVVVLVIMKVGGERQ